ncbi:hypothetical protein ACB098_01G123700 [Castanea mollissima]
MLPLTLFLELAKSVGAVTSVVSQLKQQLRRRLWRGGAPV